MSGGNGRGLDVQRVIAAGILAIGLALLAFMVTVEGEPGLLPLLLVLAGGTWLAAAQWRVRTRRRRA